MGQPTCGGPGSRTVRSSSPDHEDYPALLAEASNQLALVGWQLPPAASVLGVTRSQLIGLFRKEPKALASLNTLRRQYRLRPII